MTPDRVFGACLIGIGLLWLGYWRASEVIRAARFARHCDQVEALFDDPLPVLVDELARRRQQ